MKAKTWKKKIKNFFIDAASSGKYEKKAFDMSDYLIRYVLLNFISIFGGLILVGFIFVRFLEGKYDTVLACSVMLLIAVLTIVLSRMKNVRQIVPALMFMIFYGLLCIAVTWLGEAQGMSFLFIYMYPLTTIVLLGMKMGVIFSSVVLAAVSMQMFIPELSRFSYDPTVPIYMLVTYALVFSVTIVIESTRKAKDRLIDDQNKKLKELKDEAEAANQIKSNFLASISHEIRTPMNTISGMAELLLRGELSEESRKQVQDIKKASTHLVDTISDIMDYSIMEAGKLEIFSMKYFLSSLLNSTISAIKTRLAEKQLNFLTEIDGNLPSGLVGDEPRIRQILFNLLSNAVKYTDSGHIKLAISADSRREKAIWLKISVEDTGSGIRAADREKLFGDFVQLNTKKKYDADGTGLGLAIAKRLCLAMGGDISVESEYGKGSTFTVIIPQGIHTEEPYSAMEARPGQTGKAGFTLPQVRILLVDDIAVNLKVAEGLLEPYNAIVESCLSGMEAIQLVKRRSYDLIFMDHMMPEMDGIEAVAAIRTWERMLGDMRSIQKEIPIIALTANVVNGIKEIFLENGFNDFLAKPIDTAKLDEILARWIPEEKRSY
ncbi:MAG: ATP-binding protein [Treponema sp.]|nr:ATP-binding protein [Treponema sp.]